MNDGLEGGTNQSQEPPPLFSTIGERGPQGDPGHEGHVGPQGREGKPGTPADPRQVRRNTHRVTFVFCLVVFLFLVGGVVLQRQQHRLAHAQAQVAWNNYIGCISGNKSLAQLNHTFDQLAAIEKTNPYTGANIGVRRIEVYQQSKFDLFNCGTKPHKP